MDYPAYLDTGGHYLLIGGNAGKNGKRNAEHESQPPEPLGNQWKASYYKKEHKMDYVHMIPHLAVGKERYFFLRFVRHFIPPLYGCRQSLFYVCSSGAHALQ